MAAIDMRALARIGAQARVEELQQELAEIRRAFPGLGVVRSNGRALTTAATTSRTKRVVTAAQRAAVSRAQKARWAKWRKAQAKA